MINITIEVYRAPCANEPPGCQEAFCHVQGRGGRRSDLGHLFCLQESDTPLFDVSLGEVS